jgi:predicted nucleic acid-binding protein
MSESAATVVCDAGPLIHLDEVSCLFLLNDFDQILVPKQVWDEVIHHRSTVFDNPRIRLQRVEVTISEDPTFQTLVSTLTLDLGEQAALTLMQENPRSIFLTDDAAARFAGVTLGYQVHGTIGILIRAIRRQQKTPEQVLIILNELPFRSTLHIRPKLLQEIIKEVKQLHAQNR